ncbi:MAG TPA: response regulator, partial [Candidatus Limnocylindria bacterium]|nr:response regulator [Candidatus Limnocylindria bacterium]
MADTPPSTYLLVVDDDRGLLRLMERALTREGHVVMTAQSGSEAIETALHSLPALMVLDLKLGDMEGIEVVNRLRGNGSTIPFIVVTGQGDERVAVDMMKRGALDYLVKDFRFQESLPAVVTRGLKQIEQIKKLNAAEEALNREIAL